MRRWPIALAAALALAVLLALGAGALWRRAPPAEASSIGGPFTLVDQTGATVDQRILRGKWSAVFFGYTYCPDVCPTTLTGLGRVTEALGADARRFQVVFVTVDPQRDTPRALATYLASPSFPRGVIGLTGAPAQIARAAGAYRVFYQRRPQGSSYTMDHTAVVYLMDPRGRFDSPLDLSTPPAQTAAAIRQRMAG